MHSEFTVDLAKRVVAHSSGASASFYEYEDEDVWERSDVVMLHNPDLYSGPRTELAARAKEAALAAGMKARRAE